MGEFAVPVTYVIGMLACLTGALGFVARQLLATKQQEIGRLVDTITKQETQAERNVLATEQLRDTVRDQDRNIEDLRAQMAEMLTRIDRLTTELIDRRGPSPDGRAAQAGARRARAAGT